MATSLPAVGTTYYNGFTFPVETETTSLVATPIQDAAKRTISHIVYSITLHSRLSIAAGSTMDTTMDTVRKQLTAQAGAFYYEDKGLGNISVNVPGRTKKDVVWGPIPRVLRLKPHGQNAVDLVWQVDVAIPECDAAMYEGRAMEFNYKLSFSVQTNGYQTRTYSGYVRIPMTRRTQSDRTIPWNIDDWRIKINPALVPGFRRVPGNFTIDESRTRLDFSIEDEEVGPTFPPAGTVTAVASHDVRNLKPGRFVQYVNTISAEYEIVRGSNPYVADSAFMALVKSRIDFVKANRAGQGAVFVPLTYSASEPEIYGHTKAKFSMSYIITLSVPILFTDSLWQVVPNSDWSQWVKPLSIAAWKPNGNAGLRFDKSQDAIVDLCLNAPTLNKMTSRIVSKPISSLRRIIPDMGEPTPFESWLLYENNLRIEERSTTIVHQPLANSSISTSSSGKPATDYGSLGSTSGYRGKLVSEPDSIIQQRSAPIYTVVMEGRAIRVGFEIPEPKLITLGGIPMFPYDQPGDGFSMGIIGNVGVPIYSAKWRKRYVLPSSPRTASPLPTPQNDGKTSTLSGKR